MKSIALVGIFITMMIVLYLTISKLKSKPQIPTLGLDGKDSTPASLTDLPAAVKGKLNEALERNEAERKTAEEVLSQ